jgi:hypothetical protein
MSETQPAQDNVSQSRPRSRRTTVLSVVILLGALVLLAILMIAAASTARKMGRDYMVKGASRMIEASSLEPAEKQDATATVREFFTKAVADRIPKDKMENVIREVMSGPYGKLLQIAAVQRAIEKSELEKEKKTAALESAHVLSAAYAEKLVSDAELAPILEAIPKDEQGQPVGPPWTSADLDQVLSRAGSIFQGREIKPKDAQPDFPDAIRRAVRAMKEAAAATVPEATQEKPSH